MKKILNIFVALQSILLILSGFTNLLGDSTEFKLEMGGMYLTIQNPDSLLYILLVNFIGGGCMLYHSLRTFSFRTQSTTPIQDTTLDMPEQVIKQKGLNRKTFVTGIVTLLLSLWLAIRFFILLAAFRGNIKQVWPLALVIYSFYLLYTVLLFLLVSRNMSLHLEIRRTNYERYKAEERKRELEKTDQ